MNLTWGILIKCDCFQAENKAALQKELSLPVKPDVPFIGFIGRLDYQKGADLVLGAVPWLMEQDVQLVCLGTGDVSLEVRVPQCQKTHTIEHDITAASLLEGGKKLL